MKPQIRETSNPRPILEPIVEPSNVEKYLEKRGVLESNEKYIKAERVFKAKTKSKNWKVLP